MSPKLLNANMFSVTRVASNCAFFAHPPRAQEIADLAKLTARIKDKSEPTPQRPPERDYCSGNNRRR